jgi:protein tyrosine/serine phosphatase
MTPTRICRPGPSASILAGLLLALLARPGLAEADLPNFHPVAPGVWRGAAPTEAGLRRLKAMGVKTVVDLRIAPKTVRREGAYARSLGLEWINLPMGADPPTPRQVSTLLAALDRAPARPVFVHCQHGADRTGCMIGIYRVTRQGWPFGRAYAEMRQDGFDPRWGRLRAAVRQRAK